MELLTKSIELDLKSLTDSGQFTGYGSVFNVVDKGKDIVLPGAFAKSLTAWKANGRNVPMLWQHKTDEPIGNWPNLKEDGHGLLGTDAELWLAEAPYAKIAQKGMRTKTITGLSIGYRVKDASYDQKTGVTALKELDLIEISVVTNPMNDLARATDVKSMLEAGQLPNMKDFEDFLREAGFSKTQAVAVANGGLSKLLRGEPGSTEGEKALKLLNEFTLKL